MGGRIFAVVMIGHKMGILRASGPLVVLHLSCLLSKRGGM